MTEILLVDDSPLYREMSSNSLQDEGYSVLTAENGFEAYEKWQNESVDGIVTDLNMPELNGFELIRQIRNKPGGSRIPILVATVRKQKSDVKRAIEYGADNYVIKDQNEMDELIRKVNSLLDER